MANPVKEQFLKELCRRYGAVTKLSDSNSLYIVGDDAACLYLRYSKVHPANRTFFGLREMDLRQLHGRCAFIVFLTDRTDDRSSPIIVPFDAFEHVFQMAEPAGDGQYKVQLVFRPEAVDLYIAGQGLYNVDGYIGFSFIDRTLAADRLRPHIDLQHRQVQTLLAAIGRIKGYDIFVPDNNVGSMDWSICPAFDVLRRLPPGYETLDSIVSEIDVLWVRRGSARLEALFEVEHSTPVYSGLLRFNDMLLSHGDQRSFYIVSNNTRRDLFARQIARPTFRCSGLADHTSFLDYLNVFDWFTRLTGASSNATKE